jgi:hypothetical protein
VSRFHRQKIAIVSFWASGCRHSSSLAWQMASGRRRDPRWKRVQYRAHHARDASADRFSTILKIGPLPTPCHPRVHQGEASLAARSIENVFHLHRSPSPTARRRDIAGIRVLKGPCLGYGQAPPPLSLALILPNSTSELSLDCPMCVAQIRIPTRTPPPAHGSRSTAFHECAQVCFARRAGARRAG